MNYQRRRALTCHEGPLDRSQKRKLIIGNACYPMAFRSRPKRVRAHLFRSRNSRIPCLSATNNVISFGFFGRLSPAGLPKELCGTGYRPLWPVVYKKVAVDWQAGKGYMGASACLPPFIPHYQELGLSTRKGSAPPAVRHRADQCATVWFSAARAVAEDNILFLNDWNRQPKVI